jgi:predicted small metal-binding protein
MSERQGARPTVSLRCACGWEARGAEDEVITATRDHGRRVHNMEATDAQIIAMIESPDPRSERDASHDGNYQES